MASLVRIEHDIKPLRHAIHQQEREAARFAEFDKVVALHRQASDQVSRIMASDQRTMKALREAELARRFAAQTLELGEATLAAYRRVVTPQVANAALVNKRG
jgi:primosomal protein N''